MANRYCTIYIVRHGQTEGNTKQLLQGHLDTPLTKTGESQARQLAKKFKRIHFAAVFSSDLLRAKRTAEIIILEKQIAVKTRQALRERMFGKFEGKSYEQYNDELKEMFVKYTQLSDAEKFTFKPHPDVESDEELVGRVIVFLREVAVAYLGKKILLVSHGGVMRALLIHLGFGTSSELAPGCVKNLAYVQLESDGIDFFVKETEGIERKT